MFFFATRFHHSRSVSTVYEKRIADLLEKKFIHCLTPEKYRCRLALQEHASKVATAIHQLSGLSRCTAINTLSSQFASAMQDCLGTKPAFVRTFALENSFALLESQLKAEKCDKISASIFLLSNAIVFCVGVAGIMLFGAGMVLSSPIEISLLAAAMVIMSAVVTALAAYSLYVDGRFLFDRQLNDIKTGINFLSNHFNTDSVDQTAISNKNGLSGQSGYITRRTVPEGIPVVQALAADEDRDNVILVYSM
jgi:hypothetical protein